MVFKKIIFQNSLMANETPSRPPPFMANAILNFHFDFLHTSLIVGQSHSVQVKKTYLRYILPTNFLKISPVSISIVQAVRLTPSTMPTVLGLIKSCRIFVLKRWFKCVSPLLIRITKQQASQAQSTLDISERQMGRVAEITKVWKSLSLQASRIFTMWGKRQIGRNSGLILWGS